MMRACSLSTLFFYSILALLAALVVAPDPAAAQFGLDRAFKKVLKAPKLLDPGLGGGSRRSGGGSGGSSGEEQGTSESATTNKEVKKEIDRLEKARLLRNAVATVEEAEDEKRSELLERQRNVEQAVQDFISCLKGLHGLPSRKGTKWICEVDNTDIASKGSEISQVTAGEIMRELEEAYRGAHLHDFERLAGEIWTRERLLVRIVDQSRMELPPYFKGVGAKGPSMSELKKVFANVARDVYSRALEISEIIGVSNSFDRFIRTVYEHGGDEAPSQGLQGAMHGIDGRFERVATAALSAVPREKFIRDGDSEGDAQAADPLGLERQFRFRFRARRIYYECLSVSYADLAKGFGGGRAIEASHTNDRPQPPAVPAPGTVASARSMPEPVLTGSIEGMAGDAVWSKTQAVVHDKCRGSIDRVAKMAIERKIRPESARWTGGLSATMTSDKQEQRQEQGEFLPSGNKKDQ